MNTFLKVLLLALAVVIAIKLFPLTLALAFLIGGLLLVTAVVGVSAAAVILAIAIVAAAALSPIWVPLLVIVGIVALVRRSKTA